MRISNALACALVAVLTGIAGPALALDTLTIKPDTSAADALRSGLNALKDGNVPTALEALKFAADKGLVSARWKLAEIYAAGDGVTRDDYRAFQLYSEIANNHADDSPRDPAAPYVSNAFVKLGAYYRTGISHSPVRPNLSLARQYFTYAASYFGDAAAQLSLARMYYVGEGGDRDLVQAARWANLSADKGNGEAKTLVVDISLDLAHRHLEGIPSPYDVRQAIQWSGRAAEFGSVEGQALYGKLLFDGDGITRQPIDGLMYLAIAVARSGPDDGSVRDMQVAALAKATGDEWSIAKQRAEDWLKKNPVAATAGALTQ
jgi:TPR repeat protein